VLCRRPLLRERPGQHELGFKYRAAGIDSTVERGRHPFQHRVLDPPLDIPDRVTGVALIPTPVEVFRHGAELDDEVFGKVFRLDLPALLPPKPHQRRFVIPHNDSRV
jgi:hypothetical protein